MQQVISEKQARQILGGRSPHLPVEYETAVKALAECVTLDEAKYWDNKADALAAWAKIYHSPDAERKAKQLKLHAYKRMGELAEEIRPSGRPKIPQPGFKPVGTQPGAVSVLIEQGFTKSQADRITGVAKVPRSTFERLVQAPKPPSPSAILRGNRGGSAAYKAIMSDPPSMQHFRTFCRKHDAYELARGLEDGERAKVRLMLVEITEWLDAFEQALPTG